jgi:hypothetical protein
MDDKSLPYDLWIEEALRDVVRRALGHAAEHGLPGSHHFYVTFRTDAPGVEMSPRLRAQYPEAMTIVLQHQFWDLVVDGKVFSITLKFRGKPERLTIPLSAVTGFADPVVNFGLQLKVAPAAGDEETAAADGTAATPPADGSEPGKAGDAATGDARGSGEVIALDVFRKK